MSWRAHGNYAGSSDGSPSSGGAGGTSDIVGTPGNDSLYSASGNQVIYGGDGNDLLVSGSPIANGYDASGAGNNTIFGGNGNDQLAAGSGSDLLFGGNGSDSLYGGSGNVTMYGGAGADLLAAGSGSSVLFGGDGSDDLVNASHGNATLYGGAGNDHLYAGSDGATVMYGGAGNDILTGTANINAGPSVMYGGDGNDSLTSILANDTMYGGAGNDTIASQSGRGIIYGGAGDDLIKFTTDGNPGTLAIYGGDGNDTIQAGYAPSGALRVGAYYGGAGVNQIDFSAAGVNGIELLADTGQVGGSIAGSTISGFQQIIGAGNDTLEAAAGVWVDSRDLGSGTVMESVAAHGAETIEGGGALMGRLNVSGETYFAPIFGAANGQPSATIAGFDRTAGDKLLFTSADGVLSNMTIAPATFTVANDATGHAATAAGSQFIYEQDTHQLWYDADGAGSVAAVLVATLDPAKSNFGPALTASDFVLHHA